MSTIDRFDAPAGGTRAIADASAQAAARVPRGLGAVLPLAVIVVLELAVRWGVVPSHLMPAPSDVLRTLVDLSAHDLYAHVLASVTRVAIGFSLGAVAAVVLGACVGLSPHARALLEPSFQGLKAIPSLAWVPLLLLWLGIDEAPKLTLIAIGAFFPIYAGVTSGLRDVDRKLIEVATLAGLSRASMVRRVLLPAALPAVFTGVRNGLSLAWMFMVAAELIAATHGLGYLLTDGRETGRADIVCAAIVVLAVLGKLSDFGLHLLEVRWLAWRDTLDTMS